MSEDYDFEVYNVGHFHDYNLLRQFIEKIDNIE
jgi:hypothetical protein